MTQQEALQWLADNKALFGLSMFDGQFIINVIVEDRSSVKHHCRFSLDSECDFVRFYLEPTATRLRKSIDG